MFFKNIGDLRVDHDLTQKEAADYLDIQREVYRRYEKGIRNIRQGEKARKNRRPSTRRSSLTD